MQDDRRAGDGRAARARRRAMLIVDGDDSRLLDKVSGVMIILPVISNQLGGELRPPGGHSDSWLRVPLQKRLSGEGRDFSEPMAGNSRLWRWEPD